MKSVHIAGGDKRQLILNEMLKQKGYHVSIEGFEKAGIRSEYEDADIVFLPVPYLAPDGNIKAPFSKSVIEPQVIAQRYEGSMFVLGRSNILAQKLFGEHCFDLLADESFLIDNAALSAEGAILCCQNYTQTSLLNANCVVVGYGRIAKILCSMLKGYTGNIMATARKQKDFALLRAAHIKNGHTNDLLKIVSSADVVFNTVPYHVFSKSELLAMKKGAVLIELASPPYGCDIELAQRLGIDVRIESGIPGRCFPKSAAEAMMRSFEREEKRGWN